MPVRPSTPDWRSLGRLAWAARSAKFREQSAIPKQLRAGICLLTAFLIEPIRREGVMRTNLLIAVVLLGCVASAAMADEPAPALPNPQVNIQQPELARPMPRPRIKRPDPPVKVAVKKSSRPERQRKSKRRPEKTKPASQRRVVEAKAKTPARRPSPAKPEKAAASDATSSVEAPAQQKPPAADLQFRKTSPATAEKEKPAGPQKVTEPEPAIEQEEPGLQQQEPVPEETKRPDQAPEQQTATVSRQPTAESQEERTLWWARQGSPAVARFRDCVAAFATRNVGKDSTATWADLLIRAAEGDCRVPFNDMAHILSTRLGSDAESVIRSLIETTFLPAARNAVSSTQRVAGGKSDPAPPPPAPAR
jgi:hypothetical protein